MFTTVLLAGATVAATFITFGGIVKKLLAAPVIVDAAASGYFLSTYASTGTISGLTVGVIAVLFVSITIRAWRYFFGYQRLSVDGDTRLAAIVSHLLTGFTHWTRQIVTSLATGRPVIPPAPFNFQWDTVPGVFSRQKNALVLTA